MLPQSSIRAVELFGGGERTNRYYNTNSE